MKSIILNYLPTNYTKLSFTDKKFVVQSIKTEIKKSKSNINVLNS